MQGLGIQSCVGRDGMYVLYSSQELWSQELTVVGIECGVRNWVRDGVELGIVWLGIVWSQELGVVRDGLQIGVERSGQVLGSTVARDWTWLAIGIEQDYGGVYVLQVMELRNGVYCTVHCPKSQEQFLSHGRDVTIKTITGKKYEVQSSSNRKVKINRHR